MSKTLIMSSVMEVIAVGVAVASYPENEARSTVLVALIVAAIIWDVCRYRKVKALERDVKSILDRLENAA